MAVSRYGPVELLPLWLFLFSSGLFAITVIHLTLRRKLGVSDFIEIPAKILKVNIKELSLRYGTKFSIKTRGIVVYETNKKSTEKEYNFVSIIDVLPLSNWLCSSSSVRKIVLAILNEKYTTRMKAVCYQPEINANVKFLNHQIPNLSVVAVFISLILPFLILFGVFQYPQYLGRYEQYYGFKYIILTGVVGFAVGLIMSLDSLRLFISGDNNP